MTDSTKRNEIESESFHQDITRILHEKSSKDPVPRRLFLQTAAMLGISPLLFKMTPAFADVDELVIVNWGGDAETVHRDSWARRYETAHPEISAVIDGSGPSSGKIKAMVESGNVTWDLCDRNNVAAVDLGRQGLLEEVDYSRVDPDAVPAAYRGQWGLGSYYYSFGLTWDTSVYDETPTQWTDLWDKERFPGTRTMRKNFEGQLESALIADGVAMEDLYPLDVDRALAKINEIKEDTIFWGSGSESQQIMRDGDAVIGNLWHTRASIVHRETDGRVDYTLNQAILFAGAWIQPKGAPGGAAAWDFARIAQDPESQVEVFLGLGMGPINPAAAELVPTDMRHRDPGNPENLKIQVAADADWYASDYSNILNRYLDTIAS